MSPEAIALVFALLCGPTVLWLGYRVIRGPENRRPDPFTDRVSVGVTSQLAPELPILSEYWLCGRCRSANRQGTSRCYSCKEERVIADMSATAAAPAAVPAAVPAALVPVMDAAPPRQTNAPAAATVTPATVATATPATVATATPATVATVTPATVMTSARTPRRTQPVPQSTPAAATAGGAAAPRAARPKRAAKPSIPVPEGAAAADVPGSAATAAAATAAAATAAAATAAVAAVAVDRAPAARRSAAVSAVAVACPFLGLKGDAATRYSYPDERHVCHAAASGGPSLPLPRRLVARVAGDGRTQPVSAETQTTLCLTAEHTQCARFPAPGAIAGA
jgi:hypothetical protein